VLPFRLVELERASDRVKHLGTRVDRPSLFQPGVPGNSDAGEHRDLLAAQPGGPPPGARRKPDVLRGDPPPAAAPERCELSPAWVARGRRGGRHDLMISRF